MCKKLYKHEILSYLRKWLPMEIIVLGIALLGRFVQFFERDTSTYDIILGSTIFFYVTSLIVSCVLTFVLCVTRFHKNLFTGEGYLTLTLPVSPAQHILIKAAASVTVQAATFIVALISVGFITAGELCSEILKAAGYIFKLMFKELNGHLFLFILEFVVLIAIVLASTILLIYACIALGQTFNKNRTVGAVAIYFIYQFICRILLTILMTVLSSDMIPYTAIGKFIISHPYASAHIGFGLSLLWCIITAGLYFLITHTVIKKKLNLE